MGLHIIVCIKSVVLRPSVRRVRRSSDSSDLNPFDRSAIEVALQMRDAQGGSVTVLSMGPESCAFVLQEAMAMGVDRAVLISDPALAESDTLVTSTTLSSAIQKLAPFDLILFGTRSADSDTGHVGPQTATLLDLPLVTGVHSLEHIEHGLRVNRRIDGFEEQFELDFPAALTIDYGSVQTRDVLLAGLQVSFEEKKVEKWDAAALGLSAEQIGKEGSATKVLALSLADRSRKCELLPGATEAQADELVRRLVEAGLIY